MHNSSYQLTIINIFFYLLNTIFSECNATLEKIINNRVTVNVFLVSKHNICGILVLSRDKICYFFTPRDEIFSSIVHNNKNETLPEQK